MRPGPRWEGWRFGALVGGLIGCIGLASWPIIIHPMMYPETYRQIQAPKPMQINHRVLGLILGTVVAFHAATTYFQVTRKDIRQEDVQPGNMKVWSDPFDRKKED